MEDLIKWPGLVGNSPMNIATVPPPLIYLASGVLGILIDALLLPSVKFDDWIRITGAALGVVSLGVLPPVLSRFRSARTPFDVRKPASTLVTDGPYRFSRNPAYVALTLLYIGVALLLDSGWVLIFAMPLLLVMDQWVVLKEERHLEAKFGEQYRRYKSAVRRWL